jgi:hypothetical protein
MGFINFDANRPLTEDEIKNFDEYIKIDGSENNDICINDNDLAEAIEIVSDRIINNLDEYL